MKMDFTSVLGFFAFANTIGKMASQISYKTVGCVVYRKIPDNFEYLLHRSRTGYWICPKTRGGISQPELKAIQKMIKYEIGIKEEDLRIEEEYKLLTNYTAFGEPRTTTNFLAELIAEKYQYPNRDSIQTYEWFPIKPDHPTFCYPEMVYLLEDAHQFLENKYPDVYKRAREYTTTTQYSDDD